MIQVKVKIMVPGPQQELNHQVAEICILHSRALPRGVWKAAWEPNFWACEDPATCMHFPVSKPTPDLMSPWNHPLLAPIHTPAGTLFQASLSGGAEKTKRALEQPCHPTGMTFGTSFRLQSREKPGATPTQHQSFWQEPPTPLTRGINGFFSLPIPK